MNILPDNMLQDLHEFTKRPMENVRNDMVDSARLNNEEWRAYNPLTPEGRRVFYTVNRTYLYTLARWNSEEWRWMWSTRIANYCADHDVKTVVDVGGGIGTDLLAVLMRCPKARGVLIELNEECCKFAQFRQQKYDLWERLIVYPSLGEKPQLVDMTICMDVLEHMDNPIKAFTPIVKASRHLATNFCGNFKNEDFPMHLPQNAELRGKYLEMLRALDPSYINPDEVYLGRGARR